MKKKLEKILLLMSVVVMVMVCLAFESSAYDAGGKCGSKVQWKFFNDGGVLIIEGTGEMWDADPEFFDGFGYGKLGNAIKEVVIKEGVTYIGEDAFNGITSIEKLTVAGSVKRIRERAFANCTNLSDITLPKTQMSIAEKAFVNTAYFDDDSNWEDGALYIGTFLIEVKPDMASENFVIKDGTKVIASGALSYTDYFTSVTVPLSVEYINVSAFESCDGLTDIYYKGTEEQWENIVIGDLNFNTCKLGDPEVHFNNCAHNNAANHPGKDATCNAIGYTAGVFCADCESWLEGHEATEKADHKYDNDCDTTCNTCSATREITHDYNKATCTAPKTCKVCKNTTGKANGHKYTTTTTKATLKKNGKTTTKCSVCGKVSKTTTIYYPKTIKLSATSYTYNGKVKTPSVTVKDSKGKTLKKNTDYTVKYSSGRKSTGKYTVTITFKGKYSGTKKLTFTIAPAKVTLSKVTAGSKSAAVAWKTTTGASGYQVMYSTSSKFKSAKTATVSKGSSKKTTIKKLTKGKKYYFKVRAYKTVNGTKLYGAWSSVKSVKVK